jgi:hypothetical protein
MSSDLEDFMRVDDALYDVGKPAAAADDVEAPSAAAPAERKPASRMAAAVLGNQDDDPGPMHPADHDLQLDTPADDVPI